MNPQASGVDPTNPSPSVLFVHTYYPEFVESLYLADPSLEQLDFERQRRRLFETRFGVSDAYSDGLRRCGWRAEEVIVNADRLQARWAGEHEVELFGNIHDVRRQIAAAQVAHYRPDVLYVFEWNPLGDAFLADIKPRVRLLVGQIASPLPENRSFAAYDLMISSYPPIVDHFRNSGGDAELLRLAFDERVLERLPEKTSEFVATFVGGFAPSHPDRIAWLEGLSEQADLDIFGYGVEETSPDSPVRRRHRGHAWGWEMYHVLRNSRLTLNRHAHIDVRGEVVHRWANNMRLYEATGVGTCLLTESRENLPEMFEPDSEVLTYDNDADCIEKVRHLLDQDAQRVRIAEAGQRRTLRDHTYRIRMRELSDMLRQRL